MGDDRRASAGTFAVPELSSRLLDRPELMERLDVVLDRPLTVISAPAGYGKTTLAAQWCRQRCRLPVAWLSWARHDDIADLPMRVVAAFGAATGLPVDDIVCPVDPSSGSLRMQPREVRALAAFLRSSPPCVLVIDGAPLGELLELCGDLADVLSDLSAPGSETGFHLLALSRHLPPGELVALRMSGAAASFDVDDLRLTAPEVRALVEAETGTTMPGEVARSLQDRLEGWMAAAVIVAMSWPQDHDSPEIEGPLASGLDGVEGYLRSAVLRDVPPEILEVLIAASCVEEVNGALADAITGRSDGQELLEAARLQGLFVGFGARGREWYRLHRVFRQAVVLQANGGSDGRDERLRRAADWLVEHRMVVEAAECLARLDDWDGILILVTAHLGEFLASDDTDAMGRLADLVPVDFLRLHPNWALGRATADLMNGRVARAYELVGVLEPVLDEGARLVADVMRVRAGSWLEDPGSCLDAGERALRRCDELGEEHRFDDFYTVARTDHYRTSARASLLQVGAYTGEWERVAEHFVPISSATATEQPTFAMLQNRGKRATYLALVGHVAAAIAEAQLAVTIAAEAGQDANRQMADALFGLGEGLRLGGAPVEAFDPLRRAIELAQLNRRRNVIAAATASLAHALVDAGRAGEARDLIARFQDDTMHRPPPTIAGLLAAAEARVLAAYGDIEHARSVVAAAPPTSVVAATWVTLALARGDIAAAATLVSGWPDESTVASQVRRHMAEAVLADAIGDSRRADERFGAALVAAGLDGLVQPIAAPGVLALRLLRRAGRTPLGPAQLEIVRRARSLASTTSDVLPQLTEREALVMERLVQGTTLAQVAAELVVSVNTVKTQVQAIYRKFGVTSRAEALEVWQSPPSSPER